MPNYRVTAAALRMRSGPGVHYDTIGTLARHAIVAGSEIKNSWIHVSAEDGRQGWCHRGFLELQEETPPPLEAQDKYRVDATSLNLRQGPGATYAVIGSLKKGELVDAVAVSGQWAQVRKSTGVAGWAALQYMTKIAAPPPLGASEVLMLVKVDTLNVRSGPGLGYAVIGKVNRGNKLPFLGASLDWKWVNIQTPDGKTGWCSGAYLMENNDLLASPEEYPATGLHRALAENLPMRESPDETSRAVRPLKFNRVVIVDEVSADGKWKHCTNSWGEMGWCPIERLAPLGEVAIQKSAEDFPWLPIAFAEFGVREIPGAQHNPRIQEYLNSTELARKYPTLPDETDWCAAFVNWCIEQAGLPSTDSALVNPWRSWGKPAREPQRGAVTTFIWDDGWAHVAFCLGEIKNYVVCLGGNQSDAVWISVYHKKYVTGYRVV
ncbi:MAG: TIGR02594 family protein [Chloroflexi bacterium]|mgnify:CR=1 FL=1|nr:TIGR02594 family protein [Chloroflexota bacterium]